MVHEAILASQRVEFLPYGLISHLNERARSEIKTFGNLDPESFLRGDVKDLKATLGQLVKGYGDSDRVLPTPLGVAD